MPDELTINELVAEFPGYTVSAIQQAIHRGFLPARKQDRVWVLPAFESRLILSSKKPGEHWQKGRERPGKRKWNGKAGNECNAPGHGAVGSGFCGICINALHFSETNLTGENISTSQPNANVIGWSDVL